MLVPGEGESPEDWTALATEIAVNRMTIVAVDEVSATDARLGTAAEWLADRGVARIAYIASGSGARLLAASADEGAGLDQVVLISADLTDAELAALGDVPKLFVAAEGDEAGVEAADRLVSLASGAWNAVLFVPGADRGPLVLDGEGSNELIEGVVARLEERR